MMMPHAKIMTDGWPLIAALSVAQLVSWGTIYYGFSLFVVPMATELGWSRTSINGALSLGLLVSGIGAYPVGAWIDRHGGRAVMSLGSALGAVLLAAWAQTTSLIGFYLVWIGLGLALAFTLYDPVFAVVTRRFPQSYRTRITALTLVGGFASTVFMPLTLILIEAFGWRHALLVLALCNLAVALPVHALVLRDGGSADRDDSPAGGTTAAGDKAAFRRALRNPVFWGLAICFVAYYTAFSAMTFHFIPLLTDRGVAAPVILGAIAAIGPAQVAGRVVLFALGGAFSSAVAGRLAVSAMPVAVLLLIAFPTSTIALFAFALLQGAGNGVLTIVRGTAVPDLMGREGYGAINGALALPANIARALAPFGAAVIWGLAGNYDAVLWAIFASAALGGLGFWYAAARGRPVGATTS
jgi:MFS family permease